MRAVMLSVRPQWCEKICHQIGTERGKPVYEKSLEVRKNRPKIPTPFKCYIYCTVYGPVLWVNGTPTNGKVIGEFVCDDIRRFDVPYPAYQNKMGKSILTDSCCTYFTLHRYAYHDDLFGWNISDLKIYDKPKELSEFYSANGKQINRAFQNWGYVNGKAD